MKYLRAYALPLIFLLALTARVWPGPRIIDDSYITFRYAANLLNGNGLVFNVGEQVLGTTTPFYAAIMTMMGLLSGQESPSFPIFAMWVNAIADALTCVLLIRIGHKLKFPLVGYAAAMVWAVLPFSVTFAIGGLETSVYVFLLTATIYAYLQEKYSQTALLAALCVLTRPDALIFLGPLALDRAWNVWNANQRQFGTTVLAARREIGLAAAPLVSWAVIATWYYGSPIPHSITAKTNAYRLPDTQALVRLLQHYATPFMEHLTFGTWWIAVGLVLYLFLFMVGARALFKTNPRIWPWLMYPHAYFAVFALANPLIFRWYLTPPLPAYIFIVLAGLHSIFVPKETPNVSRLRKWLVVAFVLIAPTVLSLRDWTFMPDHGINRPAPNMAWIKLELLYEEAANYVSETIQPDPNSVLAAGDVGMLGYATELPMLDTVGLNSPETLPYYPADPTIYEIGYAVAPDLIIDHSPDIIVLLEVYGRKGLFINERFRAEYSLAHTIATDIYGSEGMLIYVKNP